MKSMHLRTSGDMGKQKSSRTFCNMPARRKRNGKVILYEVTEYASLVDCKRCLNKMLGNK